MHSPESSRGARDPISTVANFAGIASFILAVAGNNVERLSALQKLGLASASAVMILAFMGSLLVRYVGDLMRESRPGAACAAAFFGGWIGAGLLLAAVPLFGFGLDAPRVEMISMICAVAFAGIATLFAGLGAAANVVTKI